MPNLIGIQKKKTASQNMQPFLRYSRYCKQSQQFFQKNTKFCRYFLSADKRVCFFLMGVFGSLYGFSMAFYGLNLTYKCLSCIKINN